MVRLVADIRHFNHGVSNRLKLHRQIPVLRVWNLAAGGGWRNGKAGNAQALKKDQAVRIGPQNRVERAGGSLQWRIARQTNRLRWIQRTADSRASGDRTDVDKTSEVGIWRSVVAGKRSMRNAIAAAHYHRSFFQIQTEEFHLRTPGKAEAWFKSQVINRDEIF